MRKIISILLLAFLLTAGCATNQTSTQKTDKLANMDFREVVARAKNQVFPMVVYIKCLRQDHAGGKKITQEVSGSGVIVSADGEVVTNWHVIDKAVEVRCLLYNGQGLDAKVLGSDKDTDLALLKLQKLDDTLLPFAGLDDSDKLQEGDFVMAMGAPWGLSRSVSIGIISCIKRFLPEASEYSLWLQTDASISPGNSGGPLVNTDGKIVGINTRGSSAGGDMGFAIPSNTIKFIIPQLREHGQVNWSWTGLQLQPLHDFERDIYFDADQGVIVAETDPESPARRAGILARDRIVQINDQPVTALTAEELPKLRKLLGNLPKDQPVNITLQRNNETVKIEIIPTEKGKVEGEELDCPRWDLTVKAINRFDNPDLHFHRAEGVFIYGIKHPGNAANAGLKAQDIILKIDGKKVTTLDDLEAIHKDTLENIEQKPKIIISVLRSGLLRQQVLDISRNYEKE